MVIMTKIMKYPAYALKKVRLDFNNYIIIVKKPYFL